MKPVAESGKYQMLLKADAKHAWPMWSSDGKTLFYMSDASGAENIWAAPVASPASAKAMTHFKEGRVLWPSIGDGGKTIVFERNFTIWKMDTATGKAERVPITLRGVPASPGVTHVTETNFSTLALVAGREEDRGGCAWRGLCGVGEGWRRGAAVDAYADGGERSGVVGGFDEAGVPLGGGDG